MERKEIKTHDNEPAMVKIRAMLRTSAIISVCGLLMIGISFLMFKYTEDLLTVRLQERLVSVASTAASQFDDADTRAIRSIGGYESIETTEFARIVDKLGMLREANADIRYAYVMRKTSDPDVFEFVADADSLVPEDELDVNEDGILQEDEMVPLPSDPYEVSEFPVLRNQAFNKPSVDEELQPDQWGLVMAAYAPIYDSYGRAIAIIGIDVLVDDFKEKTTETLFPFLIFILVLIVILAVLTLLLARVWNERVEVMKELDRQKDELLGIVSHQLATPVSSIKWYLEMMLDGDVGKLNDKQVEHVQSLQFSASNLADLVSMILDVSRIQLGRMKVDRTDIELTNLFTEEAKAMEARAKEQGVDLITEIQEDMPVAMLDMRLMRMTMENLLSNAIKYTPKGGKVTLKAAVSNGKLQYSVSDTGCGIPKSEHDKIFGKLFRASNVGKIDGNGFGLYVAKGAVEAQGGTIGFTSAEGKGTTFNVSLPVVTPKNESK